MKYSSELEAEYTPDHCKNQTCVTVLSGHQADTAFVIEHIDELKLYVKVAWFGDNLRHVTQTLYKQLTDKRLKRQKAFVVVHWTPSEIIDADIEYETIVMPKCEQFANEQSKDALCKYELTPILKYCSKQLQNAKTVFSLFSITDFNHNNETYLLQMYNNMTDLQQSQHSEVNDKIGDDNAVQIDKLLNNLSDKEKVYDAIACQFIRENEATIRDEIRNLRIESKQKVYIGGLFPSSDDDKNEHFGEQFYLINFLIKSTNLNLMVNYM